MLLAMRAESEKCAVGLDERALAARGLPETGLTSDGLPLDTPIIRGIFHASARR